MREANQKAAESIATSPFDAGRGLDLALDAAHTTTRWRLAATSSAEDALRQAIQASRLEWSLPVGQLVSGLAFAPDGQSLAVAGELGLRFRVGHHVGSPAPRRRRAPSRTATSGCARSCSCRTTAY